MNLHKLMRICDSRDTPLEMLIADARPASFAGVLRIVIHIETSFHFLSIKYNNKGDLGISYLWQFFLMA